MAVGVTHNVEQGWIKGRTLNSKGSVVIMVKLLPVKQHDVSSNLTGPAEINN